MKEEIQSILRARMPNSAKVVGVHLVLSGPGEYRYKDLAGELQMSMSEVISAGKTLKRNSGLNVSLSLEKLVTPAKHELLRDFTIPQPTQIVAQKRKKAA